MSLQNKINEAVAILRNNMSQDGNVVYFSGGKDSCVLKHLIETFLPEFPVDYYYIETSFEPQTLIDYIKEVHPTVIWLKAEKNIFDIFREYGKFPSYQDKFCCKEVYSRQRLFQVARHRKVIFAQRNRERSYIEERNLNPVEPRLLRPLYNWETSEIWEYIEKYNVKVVKTYEMYGKQSNCFICSVMAVPEVKKLKLQCHPEDAEKLKEAIMSIWETNPELHKEFATKEDYWQYYIEYDPRKYFDKERLKIQVSNTQGSKFTFF